jgi:hypothetical protein
VGGRFILAVTVFWWAFALWPVGDAPDWLVRTRLVCFGVDGGGLPDRAGWVGLVGQPLGMLGALLVGWRGAVGGAAPGAGLDATRSHGWAAPLRRWC